MKRQSLFSIRNLKPDEVLDEELSALLKKKNNILVECQEIIEKIESEIKQHKKSLVKDSKIDVIDSEIDHCFDDPFNYFIGIRLPNLEKEIATILSHQSKLIEPINKRITEIEDQLKKTDENPYDYKLLNPN